MTSKPAVLFETTVVPAAETAVYASPARLLTIVNKFSACNTNSAAMQVTVKIVPSGASAATGHVLVNARTLMAGESYGFPEIVGHPLNPGDFISVLPTDTGLNVRGGGAQIGV